MSRTVAFVVDGGKVHALAGGPLPIHDMGPRTTKRVSHVEFDETKQRWCVWDAYHQKILAELTEYDEAIRWEVDYFNAHLDGVSV